MGNANVDPARLVAQEAQRRAEDARGTQFRATLEAKRPAKATMVIVAEFEKDTSDSMTDYFATQTARTVVIGWRTGSREDFRQLRAAAARFPETAHLGTGKDRWSATVVFAAAVVDGAGNHNREGQRSPWHSEMGQDAVFGTEAEARAHAAKAGDPEPLISSGDVTMTFRWEFTKQSIEHRENYSMGAGNYLKSGSRYSTGWVVRSTSIGGLPNMTEDATTPAAPTSRATVTPTPDGAPVVRASTVKPGNAEVVFNAKPAEDVRAELKAAGFRWYGPAGCWYGPAANLPKQYRLLELATA